MNVIATRVLISTIISALMGGNAASQETFPLRSANITGPIVPSGGTDTVTRLLARSLSKQWRQPVVAENKSGATGIIGALVVVKSSRNRYNSLFSHDGVFIATPLLSKRPDFDPQKQLAPLTEVATPSSVAVVYPDNVPVQSLKELIFLIKQQNAEKSLFDFATSALGSSVHITGEIFSSTARVQLLVVSYKSIQAAIVDVASGHVPFGFFAVATALPLTKFGALRSMAARPEKPFQLLPVVPTVSETLLGFQVGVRSPAGMPQSLRESLSRDIQRAVASPALPALIVSNESQPAIPNSDVFKQFICRDTARPVDDILRA